MDKFFHLTLFMTTCIQRIDSIPLCYQCMTLVQNIRPFHQPKLNPIKNMSQSLFLREKSFASETEAFLTSTNRRRVFFSISHTIEYTVVPKTPTSTSTT